MTIWYFDEPGKVVTLPSGDHLETFFGLEGGAAKVVRQITASKRALSSLSVK